MSPGRTQHYAGCCVLLFTVYSPCACNLLIASKDVTAWAQCHSAILTLLLTLQLCFKMHEHFLFTHNHLFLCNSPHDGADKRKKLKCNRQTSSQEHSSGSQLCPYPHPMPSLCAGCPGLLLHKVVHSQWSLLQCGTLLFLGAAICYTDAI